MSRVSSPVAARSRSRASRRNVATTTVGPGRAQSTVSITGVSGSVVARNRSRSSSHTTSGSLLVCSRGWATNPASDAGAGAAR